MGKQIRYEKEILEWRKRQFLLRRKYTDTPPGFRNEDQENYALKQLKKAELEYQKSCEMKLISGYQPSEEIFVGREDILRQVQEALAAKRGPVVLFGVGGMGKSAIAREYLRRRSADYDHVLLLYADDGIFSVICDDCQVQMTNMQYSKDRYGNRNNYFREKIRALRQIAKEKRLLLVIDNWDRPADKGMDAVFSLECDILVTTRMTPTVWGLREGIPVSGFETTEEWNAFLSAYGKTAHSAGEQRAMEEYCRQVGGHPLLMKLKAYAASGVSAGSEERNSYPADTEENSVKFLKNLFSCYSLKKEEKQVLRELSVMPVQGIPVSLYRKISGVSETTLRHLESCLLISCSGNSEEPILSLHPLVAETAAKMFSPTLISCRKMVSSFCDSIWNMWSNTYMENQKLEPYVFALIRAFPSPAAWMAGELERLSTWLWIQGYYEEAERWQKKIMESVEKYYGENHQVTAEMALRMAAVYYNSMESEKADLWYQKAYEILKRCEPLDVRHKRLLFSACNKISRSYWEKGEIPCAEEYLEKAMCYFREYVKLSEKLRFSRVHEESTEIILASLKYSRAKNLAARGRNAEAEYLCREAREDILSVEGEEYRVNEFDTLYIDLLVNRGQFSEALTLAKEDLERALLYRGTVYKDTPMWMERLGDVYMAAGYTEEAEKEYKALLLELSRHFPGRLDWMERVQEKILQM